MNKMSDSSWAIVCDDDVIHIDKNQKKICPDLSEDKRCVRLGAHKPIVTR